MYQPHSPYSVPVQPKSSLSTWSMATGITSLVVVPCHFGALSAVAVACGHLALREIKAGRATEGRGRAITGIATGYASLAIWVASYVYIIISLSQQ